MTKVIVSEDCGNSPKNVFLEKLTIALARQDRKFILANVTDDFRWQRVGDRLIEGKDDLAKALDQMKNDPTAELIISHVASHGKAGAVNGRTKQKDGQTRAFCHVFEFNSTTGKSIREITSYLIDLE